MIFRLKMPIHPDDTEYSEKYIDNTYEYRHVTLSKRMYDKIPKEKLLSEEEWRHIGVQMSADWNHYLIYKPEPFVLLFRRLLPQQVSRTLQTGKSTKYLIRR